jgi:hypothetical protein
MNIQLFYRQWLRHRKYQKVVAGIAKLNKIADDIEKKLPVEIDMSGWLSLMTSMIAAMIIFKIMTSWSSLLVHVFRKRSRLFFWNSAGWRPRSW